VAIPQGLIDRARLLQGIRAFFDGRGLLEVDTPLLDAASNPDPQIQSIEARVNGQRRYLQTSPEFAMKRLLAEGSGPIYQIAHAFRDEERGRRHRPEFLLLEWYVPEMDYRDLMGQVEALVRSLWPGAGKARRLGYVEAFEQYAGIDPLAAALEDLRTAARRAAPGLETERLDRDACLDLLMSFRVAPAFEGLVFVQDYPASQAALARLKPEDPRLAERFELYWGDLELANGFGELTDADEQRARFEADNAQRRAQGLPVCPLDEAFLAALARVPACSGVALGLDRLLMAMQGVADIAEVQSLPSSGG
jgi:lysyl-tRNA synthetase class 2